jgi:hypothetical protein
VVFDFERERESARASKIGQREKGRVSERGWGRADRGERERRFFLKLENVFLKLE